MDHREVGKHWDKLAPTWTTLGRGGYDYYRDSFNTPAFLAALPEISGLRGLDIGCGEGHNTRLLAEYGARISALDISEVFVGLANAFQPHNQAIDYTAASAVELPFPQETFDFATGFMSLMDIPENEIVLKEACRVLKPGGFLQFSISHPCFDTPHRVHIRDEQGKTTAFEIGDYFRNLEGELVTLNRPGSQAFRDGYPTIEIPRFTRTLSQWVNAIVAAGLEIEWMNEPRPSDEIVEAFPDVQDAQVVAYFLHIRARKPS
jgi:SAM-dependent methyltransferase